MRIRQKNGIFVKMPFFCNRKAFGRAGLPVGENGFSFSNVMFVLHFAGNRYSFYSKTQYKEKNMLREDIQNAIKEAMKNHETERLSTVRMVLAGVKEKDVDARGKGKECASDADLLSMMQTMIKQRQESAKMYRDGGREELAAKEEAEISVIQGFCRNRRRLDEGHGEGDGRLKGKICRADGFRCGFRQNQGNAGLS